jgi:hypothetical protein
VLSHSVATDTRRQPHHSASTTHHHHLVDVTHPDLEDSSVYKTPTSFPSLHSFLYRSVNIFCIGLCPTKPILLYPLFPLSLGCWPQSSDPRILMIPCFICLFVCLLLSMAYYGKMERKDVFSFSLSLSIALSCHFVRA